MLVSSNRKSFALTLPWIVVSREEDIILHSIVLTDVEHLLCGTYVGSKDHEVVGIANNTRKDTTNIAANTTVPEVLEQWVKVY